MHIRNLFFLEKVKSVLNSLKGVLQNKIILCVLFYFCF